MKQPFRLLKIFCLLLCLKAGISNAQNFTISGYVTDEKTGEALIGAYIYDEKLNVGTSTNNYGFYSLTLPYGRRYIIYSFSGYEVKNDTFILTSSVSKNVTLRLEPKTLEAVGVKAKRSSSVDKAETGKIDIPIAQIQKIPAILGEVDVIKAIQLLPGVKGGSEGSSGLYVRGGGPDQNLVLLDGVPVYNVTHLFGFFSVFNSDAINGVQLYKGGFPSRFGGRLSSVLDITMKEGNNKKLAGSFSISPIAGRLSLDGPLGRSGKTTFAVSGRRTFIDLLTRPFFQRNNFFGYYFYDLNAKICHTLSKRDKIFLSFYSGQDKFKLELEEEGRSGNTVTTMDSKFNLGWGNLTGSVRWNHIMSAKLFANYTFNVTRFQFSVVNQYNETRKSDTTFDQFGIYLKYYSGIRDWSAKADYEYTPNVRNKIRFGGNIISHGFAPGAARFNITGTGSGNFDTLLGPTKRTLSTESSIYIEDEVKAGRGIKFNAGLRAAHYLVNGQSKIYAEPRLAVNKNYDGLFALKFSYARMNQFLHLLANSGTSLPTDLWVPATDRIKPQTAQQVSAGINIPMKNNYEFTLETYYKWMSNLIDYKEGANFAAINQTWEEKVLAGKGWSYGAEFLIQKKTGLLTGWMGYTLAWANRQIDGINNDNKYPYKYDRRHDLSIVASYNYSERYSFSANFVFSTGNAMTFPVGKYRDINGRIVYEYGSKNGFRMNNTTRLDLGWTKKLHSNTKGVEQSWTFSLYNALANNNPYYVYIDDTVTPSKVKQVSLFGFIPGLAYNVKF